MLQEPVPYNSYLMDIESLREYCLSLPLATEDMPFDDTVLVFRLKGRIFACLMLDRPDWIVMKCNSERAIDLRERYEAIEPAWHWNKKYWNQIHLNSDVDRPLMEELLRHSYNEVNAKLPKKDRVTEL